MWWFRKSSRLAATGEKATPELADERSADEVVQPPALPQAATVAPEPTAPAPLPAFSAPKAAPAPTPAKAAVPAQPQAKPFKKITFHPLPINGVKFFITFDVAQHDAPKLGLTWSAKHGAAYTADQAVADRLSGSAPTPIKVEAPSKLPTPPKAAPNPQTAPKPAAAKRNIKIIAATAGGKEVFVLTGLTEPEAKTFGLDWSAARSVAVARTQEQADSVKAKLEGPPAPAPKPTKIPPAAKKRQIDVVAATAGGRNLFVLTGLTEEEAKRLGLQWSPQKQVAVARTQEQADAAKAQLESENGATTAPVGKGPSLAPIAPGQKSKIDLTISIKKDKEANDTYVVEGDTMPWSALIRSSGFDWNNTLGGNKCWNSNDPAAAQKLQDKINKPPADIAEAFRRQDEGLPMAWAQQVETDQGPMMLGVAPVNSRSYTEKLKKAGFRWNGNLTYTDPLTGDKKKGGMFAKNPETANRLEAVLTEEPNTAAPLDGELPPKKEMPWPLDIRVEPVQTEDGSNMYRVVGNKRHIMTREVLDAIKTCGFKYGVDFEKTWTTPYEDNANRLTQALSNREDPLWAEASASVDGGSDKHMATDEPLYGVDTYHSSEAYDLSDAMAIPNFPVPENPNGKFLEYQKVGIAFAYNKPGALIADAPGVGKTAQAIGVMNMHPEWKRVLIITTASTLENWKREMERFLAGPGWRDASGKLLKTIGIIAGQDDPVPSTNIVICNHAKLDSHGLDLSNEVWDFCVIDEAHNLKSRDGWQSKGDRIKKILGKFDPHGRQLSSGLQANQRLALTGTPLPNSPEEIWAFLNWLMPEAFPSFQAFKRAFTTRKLVRRPMLDPVTKEPMYDDNGRPKLGKAVEQITGAANLELLNLLLRGGGSYKLPNGEEVEVPPMMLRREKEQAQPNLPAKKRERVPLKLNEASTAKMAELNARYGEEVSKIDQSLNLAESHAAQLAKSGNMMGALSELDSEMTSALSIDFKDMAKFRQEFGMAKASSVVQYVVNILMNDMKGGKLGQDKIIVFAWHDPVVKTIASDIQQFLNNFRGQAAQKGVTLPPMGVVTLAGKTATGKRQGIIDKMQNDPNTKVIVASYAMKEGVTVTSANHIVFGEYSWTATDTIQAEDRAHRPGQHRQLNIHHLFVPGTIDEHIYRVIGRKAKLMDSALRKMSPEEIAEWRSGQEVKAREMEERRRKTKKKASFMRRFLRFAEKKHFSRAA
jgi:superfamily II DNA or RNA helicase